MCSDAWCLPLHFGSWTSIDCQPQKNPQTVYAQFQLPRHCLSLTRAHLLVAKNILGDWKGPIAFIHVTTCGVLNSYGGSFLMHLLRSRLGSVSFTLVTTGFQCAAFSIHECSKLWKLSNLCRDVPIQIAFSLQHLVSPAANTPINHSSNPTTLAARHKTPSLRLVAHELQLSKPSQLNGCCCIAPLPLGSFVVRLPLNEAAASAWRLQLFDLALAPLHCFFCCP